MPTKLDGAGAAEMAMPTKLDETRVAGLATPREVHGVWGCRAGYAKRG